MNGQGSFNPPEPLKSWQRSGFYASETSRDAAAKQTRRRMNAGHRLVRDALSYLGGATDAEIYSWLTMHYAKISPSGARTRRSELVKGKVVEFTGKKRDGFMIWRLTK